jgi:hypothetical protein
MLEGKPVILLSYSERYRARVAEPVVEQLSSHPVRPVLIGEEPLPAGIEPHPDAKVSYFFSRADMVVFLVTPDEKVDSGEHRPRLNIIDEFRRGLDRENLRDRLLVFKAPNVDLPSNINPVYEPLPLDEPGWVAERIIRQAREWGLLPRYGDDERRAQPIEASDGETIPAASVGTTDDGATRQALEALREVTGAVEGQPADLSSLERAELLVTSLAAEQQGGDVLGVRFTNRIFAKRGLLRLRSSERVQLIRAWLRYTKDDNVPGVVWLRDLSRKQVVGLMTTLAVGDADDEVRVQALRLLGTLKAPRSADEARALVEPFLTSSEYILRWAGIDFVVARGSSLRDLLDVPQLLEYDRHKTSQAAALLDLQRRPGNVLSRFVSNSYARSDALRIALLGSAARLPRAGILKATRSTTADVRRLGVELMASRPDIPDTRLYEIVSDDSSRTLRALALQALLSRGETIDDTLLSHATKSRDSDERGLSDIDPVTRVRREVYLQRDLHDSSPALSWSDVDGPERYEALAICQPNRAIQVRRDLRNDFSRLVARAHKSMVIDILLTTERAANPPPTETQRNEIKKTLDERWARWHYNGDLGEFQLSRYREAALRALAIIGQQSDVRFARVLGQAAKRDLAVAALRLFERFGTAHDTHQILSIAEQMYGEDDKRGAAELALRLAYKKDKLNVLSHFFSDVALKEWASFRLGEVPGGIDEAFRQLRGEDEKVRMGAASVLWAAIIPERRDEFLSLYMQGWHYFNVVRWWDQQLYAPDWLRPALAA